MSTASPVSTSSSSGPLQQGPRATNTSFSPSSPQQHRKRSSPAPCHFYKIGKCVKGSQCPFSHGPSPASAPSTRVNSNIRPYSEDPIEMRLGGLKLETGHRPSDESNVRVNAKFSDVITSGSNGALPKPDTLGPSPFAGYSLPPAKRKELCIFAMTGKCRYGQMCRSFHGIQCPRCLKYCLHPDDLNQNEEHIQECLENPTANSLNKEEDLLIECGICYDPVLSKPDPRFGLLNCVHAFCIACIRSWRSKYTMDAENLKSCPLCRTITYFVVPSATWVSDPDEKEEIINAYKKKLRDIPCKHFTHGLNTCPFGTSCFYSHVNPDGAVDNRTLRTVVDSNEKANVYRETKLSDFIVFKSKK